MRVLTIGEVLWDIIESKEFIGGVPLNVAGHLAAMGAEAAVLTRLGQDERGQKALDFMHSYGIADTFVQKDEKLATGTAIVTLDEKGIPSYDLPVSAYDALSADEKVIESLNAWQPDVLCYGTICQRGEVSRKAIGKVIESVKCKTAFFDVNIRLGFYPKEVLLQGFEHADILKINDEECELISRLFDGAAATPEQFAAQMMERHGIKTVVVTMGAKGCYVRWDGGDGFAQSEKVQVADTVGAGDAFSAAFLAALHRGKTPYEAAVCGNLLGGYVASHAGAIPAYDEAIRAKLDALLA